MTQAASTFIFAGGLDLASTPLATPPGKLMSGMNYEPTSEGYARVQGFERFDGQPAPSDVAFTLLHFRNGVATFALGMDIHGIASNAHATLVAQPYETSGLIGMSNFAGRLVLVDVTGEFLDGELLYSGGVLLGRADGDAIGNGGDDERQRRVYLQAAQTYRRAAIDVVPGSGPVRGVAVFDNEILAWRDNLAETFGAMFKATPTGWQEITPARTLEFSGGLVEIIDGDQIVGATSGAQATANRVVRLTGDWGTDAAGYIILTNKTGNFGAEAVHIFGSVDTAVSATGADVANPFPKGGRYQTILHNFYGTANRRALYGVNGAGKGFEYHDGVVGFIRTGNTVDAPTRIFEIAQSLGFTFAGGSIQFARPGEPFTWDVTLGAGEIGLGSDITDVLQSNETSVVFFGANKIAVLQGRDAESFQLDELTEEAGADAWSAQRVGRTLYLDARGLRDLAATQAFGNFRAGSLLERVYPYFTSRRLGKNIAVGSVVSKTKSQYRLFWDDGTGLTVYLGSKEPQCLPFSTGNARFTCFAQGDAYNGGEAMFAGSVEGYVYRLDSGTSIDGAGVQGFVMTPFNHLGSAFLDKRLHETVIELSAEPLTQIGFTIVFDYSEGEQPNSGSRDFWLRGQGGNDLLVEGGGGLWDSAVWNEFFWSAPLKGTARADTEGQGRNMSAIIACQSDPCEAPHILQTYSFLTTPRRMRRGD